MIPALIAFGLFAVGAGLLAIAAAMAGGRE